MFSDDLVSFDGFDQARIIGNVLRYESRELAFADETQARTFGSIGERRMNKSWPAKSYFHPSERSALDSIRLPASSHST